MLKTLLLEFLIKNSITENNGNSKHAFADMAYEDFRCT